MGEKLCFVCFSPNHLIKDCEHHSEYLRKFPKNRYANQKPRENKPVWNNSNKINHINFTPDHRYPHQRRPFQNLQYLTVLSKVLLKNKVLITRLGIEILGDLTINLEGITIHIGDLDHRNQVLKLYGLREKVLLRDKQYFQQKVNQMFL